MRPRVIDVQTAPPPEKRGEELLESIKLALDELRKSMGDTTAIKELVDSVKKIEERQINIDVKEHPINIDVKEHPINVQVTQPPINIDVNESPKAPINITVEDKKRPLLAAATPIRDVNGTVIRYEFEWVEQ
jgi:hypothetical protein